MIGTLIGLVLLVALLGVMFYCARMLLPLISPILGVFIHLLVAIATLYVIVVLLSAVGIHVPVPGFDDGGGDPGSARQPFVNRVAIGSGHGRDANSRGAGIARTAR
jgi:hypothetical protein